MAKIEARTTDLGIGGRKRRLNILKNMAESIKEVIDKGAKTIITVGNDETFTQMVNIVADSNVTLGYIPLGRPNKIARALGVPSGELACEVLSNRLVETIDLGKVNHSYFFSSLEARGQMVLKSGKYRITLLKNQKVNICNFAPRIFNESSLRNGTLEIVISSSSIFSGTIRDSFFPVKKIKIDSQIKKEPITVFADQSRILKTPLFVEVLPKKLKVIVGRERQF